jgi:hypothetical protein
LSSSKICPEITPDYIGKGLPPKVFLEERSGQSESFIRGGKKTGYFEEQ